MALYARIFHPLVTKLHSFTRAETKDYSIKGQVFVANKSGIVKINDAEFVAASAHALPVAGFSIEAALEQVKVLYAAGQLKQAQSICKEILQLDPQNSVALQQIGVVSHRLGEWAQARDYFMRLTELDPLDASAYYNLGHTAVRSADLDLAFAAFSKTVELDSTHARAFNNLGVILEQRGELEQAADYFREAQALDPEHRLSRLHLITLLKQLQRVAECAELIDSTLNLNSLSPDERGTLLVERAVIAWLQGDIDACRRALRLSKHLLPHMQNAKTAATPMLQNLIDLLEFRYRHPEVYEGKYDREAYYIADESCLAAADTIITLEVTRYLIVPYLVADATARDFASSSANTAKLSFNAALEELPNKSLVIVGFGARDCRCADGMLEQIKVYKKNLQSGLKSLAEDYVSYIAKHTQAKELRVILCGVAACHENLQQLSPPEQQKALYVIEHYNRYLADAATRQGMGLLDLYTASVGERGWAKDSYYLNRQMLLPSVFAEISKQYLLAPRP